MAMEKKEIGAAIAGFALVAAFLSRPGPATFQQHMEKAYAQASGQFVREGRYGALVGMSAAESLSGEVYNDYYLFSSYSVTYPGVGSITCHGAFGMVISCQGG